MSFHISEIVQGSRFKNLIKFLFNWGISIAIIGGITLLFGWENGRILIAIGGILVFMKFFFQGFEPIHEELDWTLVYPQLLGLTPENNNDREIVKLKKEIETLKKEVEMLKHVN